MICGNGQIEGNISINPRVLLYLLASVCCAAAGPGVPRRMTDEFTVTRFGRGDGMPETAVHWLSQSADGFLWCLTKNHLLRFDGLKFQGFGGLEKGAVQEPYPILYQGSMRDGEGRPWLYGKRGGAVRTREGWKQLEEWRTVLGMHVLGTDGLHAVTEDGVWRVEGAQFSREMNPRPAGGLRIRCAAADGDRLLIGADQGLFVFEKGGLREADFSGQGAASGIAAMAQGSSGQWWICAREGLFNWAGGEGRWLPTPFPGEQATALHEDGLGGVWVGTRRGLYRYDDEGGWSELSPQHAAVALDVHCILSDREQRLWVGIDDGLLCIRRKRVATLLSQKVAQGRLPINAVTAARDGRIWASSAGGGLFEVKENGLERVETPGLVDGLGISALLPHENGGLWIGTMGAGLWFRSPAGEFSHVPVAPGVVDQLIGITVLSQDDDTLLVGTRRGLFRLRGRSPKKLGIPEPQLLGNGSGSLAVFNNPVMSMAPDRTGGLWIGYEALWVVRRDLDPGKGAFGYGWGLPDSSVQTFYRDRAQRLWAGTSGGLGLLAQDDWLQALTKGGMFEGSVMRVLDQRKRWVAQGKRELWSKVTTHQGLTAPDVRQVIEDDSDNLWLGTRTGLQVFDRAQLVQVADQGGTATVGRWIGVDEGMESEECSLNASPGVAVDYRKRLFFATTNGLVRADPSALQETPPRWGVFIERVSAGQRDLYVRAENSPVALPAATVVPVLDEVRTAVEKEVRFEFNAPVFDASSKVLFRWRLDGVDKDWSVPSPERAVVYPRLQPRDYVFHVRAESQGASEEVGQPFRFRIEPRWHEMTLVRFIFAATGAGFLILGVRTVVRRQHRVKILRIKQEGAIERERARISRDLHDEMGVGLTEIGLLGDLAALPDAGETGELAAEISQRARGLVGSLDEIVWAINPANDHSLALGDYFSRYAQNLLQRAGIRCRLDVENRSLDAPIDAECRHNLFLAFKETLNNVINHAAASEVRIRIAEDGGALTVRVKDDGRGFATPSGEGSLDGLRGLRERLAAIGGSCEIHSLPGEGTSVTFSLPVRSSS